MASLYREIILDLYKNPKNYGRLENPTHKAFLVNPLCGDEIGMELIIKKGILKEIKFFGQGCAISRASASLLTEFSKKKKISEIRKIDEKRVLEMLGIEIGHARLKCALLPLLVLRKAISQK